LAAALALLVGDGLGWDLDSVLVVGAGVGGALGLIAGSSPLAKIGAFVLGMVAAAVGYALRAAVFPDNTTARALAIVIVVMIAAGLAAITFGRLPFWGLLLGAGALGGAYETAFTESPGSLLTTLPVAASSVLAVAAVAFAATVMFGDGPSSESDQPADGRHSRAPEPDAVPDVPADETVSLEDVLNKGNQDVLSKGSN
jgi:hypothetical protein